MKAVRVFHTIIEYHTAHAVILRFRLGLLVALPGYLASSKAWKPHILTAGEPPRQCLCSCMCTCICASPVCWAKDVHSLWIHRLYISSSLHTFVAPHRQYHYHIPITSSHPEYHYDVLSIAWYGTPIAEHSHFERRQLHISLFTEPILHWLLACRRRVCVFWFSLFIVPAN